MRLIEVIKSAFDAPGTEIPKVPAHRDRLATHFAAAVAAHFAEDSTLDLAVDAFLTEAARQEGTRPPDLDRMKREESPSDRQKVRAVMRAAIRAAIGGEHG